MSTESLLAAIDFSDNSRLAARRAARLAAELQVPLMLLHVMSGPSLEELRGMFQLPAEAEEKLAADARQALLALAAELSGTAGHTPGVQVRIGRVVDEVLAAAEKAGLLVLGAHGLNPLRDAILGTTAERLLRRCRQPVLVTRRVPQETYRHVLVPVDFSAYSLSALQTALRVAPRASVTVVHAFDVPFEGKLWLAGVSEDKIQEHRIAARQQALAEIGRLLEQAGLGAQRCFREVEYGDAAPVILALEKKLDADLIVIGKRGRSMIEETLLGSVTRHVLADAQNDVLVVQSAAGG